MTQAYVDVKPPVATLQKCADGSDGKQAVSRLI